MLTGKRSPIIWRLSQLSPLLLMVGLAMFFSWSCNSTKTTDPSLAETYADDFLVGAAIGQGHLSNYDTVLLKQHFSSVTAENDMKPGRTIRSLNDYSFEAGDRIVEFAKEHGLKVRGHTLVWHNQTPAWFFRDSSGTILEKEAMLERLRGYIFDVLDHYRGQVYAWDVVNEAIGNKPGEAYRDTTEWFRICGPEFIEKAFVYAREADPEVQLFYNDYNLIDPEKAQKVHAMAKDFQERGIPIDGIGMQGHWTMHDVDAENLEKSIQLFASLGLDVHITELDLSIYPHYHNIPRSSLPAEVIPFTAELEQQQAEKYKEIFEVLRRNSDKVSNVTFWGVADNKSWLSNYFVKGRTDHPLLFDTEYEPKAAFNAITSF